MKSLIRNTFVNALSLFFISQVLSGLKISDGFITYVLGGLALSLLFLIVKPILGILSAPLNFITLGLFSIITNMIIFYLLTVLVTGITIEAFTYNGLSFAGFVIPKISFNTFFAFLVTALFQSVLVSFITWMFKHK